jgi:predicted SAM-dependent methyltransferase
MICKDCNRKLSECTCFEDSRQAILAGVARSAKRAITVGSGYKTIAPGVEERETFYLARHPSIPFKLDLGSGSVNQKQPLTDWVRCDARPGHNVDIVCDFGDIPIANEQVDEIHIGDVIEHVPVYRHNMVLREWNRIMKIGAVIGGATPNLDRIMRAYAAGELDLRNALLGLAGWMNCPTEQHFVTYTKETLSAMMLEYGFLIDDYSGSPGPADMPWWLVFKGRKIGPVTASGLLEADGNAAEPEWLKACSTVFAPPSKLLTAARDFIANVKNHKVYGWGDCEPQFDASFKELEDAIK